MTCKACLEHPAPAYFAHPRKCFFDTPNDNWQCMTLSPLRDIANARDHVVSVPEVVHRVDDTDESTTFLYLSRLLTDTEVDSLKDVEGMWVSWYKNRGRTQHVVLLHRTDGARLPTEKEVLTIVEVFGTKYPSLSSSDADLTNFTPGSPDDHIGYFVVLDENGSLK